MSNYIEKATKQAVESIREAAKQAERDLGQMTKAIWESTAAAIRDLEVHAEAMAKVDQAPGTHDHFFTTEIPVGDKIGDSIRGISLPGAVILFADGDKRSIGAGSCVHEGPWLEPGRRYRMTVAFTEFPTCGWEGCEQEMNHHGNHDTGEPYINTVLREVGEERKAKEEYIAAVTPLEATQADNGLPTMEVPKKFAKGIVVPPRDQEDLCKQCGKLECEASRSEIPLAHCAYCWELVAKKDLTGKNNVWCSSCAEREAKNSARIAETKALATHTGRGFDDPPDIQRGTRQTCGVCHHLYFPNVKNGSLDYCEVCVLDPSMEKEIIVVNPDPKRCNDSYHAPECDSHGLDCKQHKVPIEPPVLQCKWEDCLKRVTSAWGTEMYFCEQHVDVCVKNKTICCAIQGCEVHNLKTRGQFICEEHRKEGKNSLPCKTCHEAIYFNLTPAGVAAPQCCGEACTKKWVATIKKAHRDLSKGRRFCGSCGAAHEMKSNFCGNCDVAPPKAPRRKPEKGVICRKCYGLIEKTRPNSNTCRRCGRS